MKMDCSGQPKRALRASSFQRKAAKTRLLLGYGGLGALLLTASGIPAVEGAGTVEFAAARTIEESLNDPRTVVAADIDSDGDFDIVAGLYAGSKVLWYENLDGKGTFPEEGDEITGLGRPTSVAVGDLNGDGHPDLVATFFYLNAVMWFENVDGLGGFSAEYVISELVDGANHVAVADIDGDGDMDVITASAVDDRVTWFENTDGAGAFAEGVDLSDTADSSEMVLAADLDGDGDIDVLGASLNDNRVTWYENSDGAGRFALGVDLGTDVGEAKYVVAADLDGDDDLDVVSAGYSDGRFRWYENTDGAATFGEAKDIDLLDSAQSVVAVDLDGDGDNDLVACDHDGGRIVWYENTDGLGSFSEAIDIALDVGVHEVIAMDLDGDGDYDLVSVNSDENWLVWYENLLATGAASASSDGSSSTTTPAPTVPLATATSGEDGDPSGGIGDDISAESPASTPAPGAVNPPVEARSTTDTEGDSSDKWADAAWEIAVTVIGGVLVAGLGALVVAWIHKKNQTTAAHQPPVKTESAIINIHNHSQTVNNSTDGTT